MTEQEMPCNQCTTKNTSTIRSNDLENRCKQVSSTVEAARAPLMLALSWTFIWFIGLYNVEFSYIHDLNERYKTIYTLSRIADENLICGSPALIKPDEDKEDKKSKQDEPQKDAKLTTNKTEASEKTENSLTADVNKNKCPKIPATYTTSPSEKITDEDKEKIIKSTHEFIALCRTYVYGNKDDVTVKSNNYSYQFNDKDILLDCKKQAKYRYEKFRDAAIETHWISFPAGLPKIMTGDLVVSGNLGLILILLWTLFAVRRENHAIRTIIDIDDNSRETLSFFPNRFKLVPNRQFTALDISTSFYAISPRFVFILTKRDRPLQYITALLLALPAFVSFWHLYTDIRDIQKAFLGNAVTLNVMVGMLLSLAVAFLCIHIAKIATQTSAIINGWGLAEKFVWSKQGQKEHDTAPADNVFVDLETQYAKASDCDRGQSTNKQTACCKNEASQDRPQAISTETKSE